MKLTHGGEFLRVHFGLHANKQNNMKTQVKTGCVNEQQHKFCE